MYSRPEPKNYDSAWLIAEREFATRTYGLSWYVPPVQGDLPLGEDVLIPQPEGEQGESKFAKA